MDALSAGLPAYFSAAAMVRTRQKVYADLCRLVEEHVGELLANKEKIPPDTAGKANSGKFVVRIGADLHKKAAVKAMTRGESLNQFVAEAIAEA
jgi:predicted HicB family RNase H-like nuclease